MLKFTSTKINKCFRKIFHCWLMFTNVLLTKQNPVVKRIKRANTTLRHLVVSQKINFGFIMSCISITQNLLIRVPCNVKCDPGYFLWSFLDSQTVVEVGYVVCAKHHIFSLLSSSKASAVHQSTEATICFGSCILSVCGASRSSK